MKPKMLLSNTSLSIFNIVYMILGYYLLVAGLLYFQLYRPIFSDYDKETLDTIILLDAGRGVAAILILFFLVYGIIMLAIGVLGVYSTSTRSVCRLRIFAIMLAILCSGKVVLSIATVLMSLDMLLPLQVWGYMTVNFVKMGTDEHSVKAQIFLQNEYECCGVNNYTDYFKLFANSTVYHIYDVDNCTNVEELKFIGCESRVSESYFCQWKLMGIILLIISLLELIGVILAHRLMKRCRARKEFRRFRPEYYLDDFN